MTPCFSLVDRASLAERLDCPFPHLLNAAEQAAQDVSTAWLRQTGLLGERRFVAAVRARMAGMTAGFYPDASPDALVLATKYLCWAFALDDEVDETRVGSSPQAVDRLAERFDRVLSGAPPLADDEPLTVSLAQIVAELHTLATAVEVERFRSTNLDYLDALVWEANNRRAGVAPSLRDYARRRPAAGAVPPFFALIEPMQGFRLTEDQRAEPRLAALEFLAGRIVCWINDVLSVDKELDAGDVHNLVILFEGDYNRAVALCNDEVDAFVRLAKTVSAEWPDSRSAPRMFIRTLESMMRVTLEWTLASPRYLDESLFWHGPT